MSQEDHLCQEEEKEETIEEHSAGRDMENSFNYLEQSNQEK